jgi:hypothetical protein
MAIIHSTKDARLETHLIHFAAALHVFVAEGNFAKIHTDAWIG